MLKNGKLHFNLTNDYISILAVLNFYSLFITFCTNSPKTKKLQQLLKLMKS